jgi:hypothetical protein
VERSRPAPSSQAPFFLPVAVWGRRRRFSPIAAGSSQRFVDRSESARTADRPQLQVMLARLAEDTSIDCLVVHKLDRLARDLADHAAVRAALRKAGVRLHSVTEDPGGLGLGQARGGDLGLDRGVLLGQPRSGDPQGPGPEGGARGWPSRGRSPILRTKSLSRPFSVHTRARWWRWGDSNPRGRATVWVFSGRIRWIDLASGLPPAEGPSASPGAMSLGGPRAEPPR